MPNDYAESDHIVSRPPPANNESAGLAGFFVALRLLCRS